VYKQYQSQEIKKLWQSDVLYDIMFITVLSTGSKLEAAWKRNMNPHAV
jgi:hypothetical protein